MKKLALVTGASSGIGQAYARRLLGEGYDVIAVGRRRERLEELGARAVVADLGSHDGVKAVAEICAGEPLDLLVNNAGVSHYMPFEDLPDDKAQELLHVKVVAPTMLSRAAIPGMLMRKTGTIVNVAGMLGFGASVPMEKLPPQARRAVYVATLAHVIALSQALHQELHSRGIRVQVLCPGVVATEFHTRQGMDLSALPRMTAEDVVTASRRGIDLGEVVCSPGVEKKELLDAVVESQLAAFHGQSAQLAARYHGA